MTEGTVFPDPGRPDFCARCAAPLAEQMRGGRLRPVCPRCGWVYYARPALGAAVLVELDGRVLLVQRRRPPYQGFWMLPAGFVEYDECAADTAVREAWEETGLRIRLLGTQGFYYGTDDPRNPSHLVVYHAEVIAGEPRAGDDAAAVATFAPHELPADIAFQGQRQALAAWQQAKGAARSDL